MSEFDRSYMGSFERPDVSTPQWLELTVTNKDGNYVVAFWNTTVRPRRDGKPEYARNQVYEDFPVPNVDPTTLLATIERFETEYIASLEKIRLGAGELYKGPLDSIKAQIGGLERDL